MDRPQIVEIPQLFLALNFFLFFYFYFFIYLALANNRTIPHFDGNSLGDSSIIYERVTHINDVMFDRCS